MKATTLRWPALAAIATLALTACATGTGNKDDDGNVYDPNAELTGAFQIVGFGLGDEIATVRYEKAQEALGSDVDFEVVEGGFDIQQFLSSVAAGDPPDIIRANRDQIGSLAARGALLPLENCIVGESIDMSQYRENAIGQVTFDGKVYALPEFSQVQLTMANSKLLADNGLTIDDVNGSDWDAMRAANEALASAPGGTIEVIGLDSKLPEFFPLWAKANGVDILSSDGKTANLNDPKAVEALEHAIGIYEDQGGFPAVKAYRDSADFFGGGNQFATDVLGAMFMEQWYVNVLNDVSPDATVAFDTFRTPEGKPLAFNNGNSWAIPKGSANAPAACRFAMTMTSVDAWVAAAEERVKLRGADGKPFTGLLTANTVADEQIRAMVTDAGGDNWNDAIDAMYEANDNSFALPASPADAEFKSIWQDAVNRVLNGEMTVQESLDRGQNEAQDALDEGWADLEKRK